MPIVGRGSEGYQTQLYRKSVDLPALIDPKGGVGVIVDVPPVLVTVSAGPCGRSVSALGEAFVPEPG